MNRCTECSNITSMLKAVRITSCTWHHMDNLQQAEGCMKMVLQCIDLFALSRDIFSTKNFAHTQHIHHLWRTARRARRTERKTTRGHQTTDTCSLPWHTKWPHDSSMPWVPPSISKRHTLQMGRKAADMTCELQPDRLLFVPEGI